MFKMDTTDIRITFVLWCLAISLCGFLLQCEGKNCYFSQLHENIKHCEFSGWLSWPCDKCHYGYTSITRFRAVCCSDYTPLEKCMVECNHSPNEDRENDFCWKHCPGFSSSTSKPTSKATTVLTKQETTWTPPTTRTPYLSTTEVTLSPLAPTSIKSGSLYRTSGTTTSPTEMETTQHRNLNQNRSPPILNALSTQAFTSPDTELSSLISTTDITHQQPTTAQTGPVVHNLQDFSHQKTTVLTNSQPFHLELTTSMIVYSQDTKARAESLSDSPDSTSLTTPQAIAMSLSTDNENVNGTHTSFLGPEQGDLCARRVCFVGIWRLPADPENLRMYSSILN